MIARAWDRRWNYSSFQLKSVKQKFVNLLVDNHKCFYEIYSMSETEILNLEVGIEMVP